MKKHKHEAMIKEWLDNGMPEVEFQSLNGGGWSKIKNPAWDECYEYRLVYPPKPKKKIEMLCWLRNDMLIWQMDRCSGDAHWKRVPSEDKIIEVDE